MDREEAVSTINKFIETKDTTIIAALFDYLCWLKKIDNKDEAVKAVIANPMILFFITDLTLREVETHFQIYRVTDKNNNLITVF